MSTIVIMPGGFHPLHAGHMALYNSAKEAFPDADVYVAATNDTKTRPFPFAIKEKLAKVAGVAPGHFIQVKSPFQPKEITDKFNPEQDVVIFVRSEKDRNESPKPGGTKKDGSPAYFQPYTGKDIQPFGQHAYMAYLPTVEFGPGISSATEIRNAWPTLNDKRKTVMVMSLYPVTQKNPKLAANVVKMLDIGMSEQENVEEAKKKKKRKSSRAMGGYFFPGYAYYGDYSGSEGGEGGGESKLNEFVPPNSNGGDGGDNRSRRIRKLLEIAIQVAKEKNVDELGMIHAMNMIAGDDYFNVAVEGILPDITDKEYMFVLQSAYKTVKQGLAEGLDEAVGGNYLYHATSLAGLKGILQSGYIGAQQTAQAATNAQTKLPSVAVTRDWNYAAGSSRSSEGVGQGAVIVFDRNSIESKYKTFGTSQSSMIKGLPNTTADSPQMKKLAMQTKFKDANKNGKLDYDELPAGAGGAALKHNYFRPKAGAEAEEAVVVPKGNLPLQGSMIGFWVDPKSELASDPTIMNDPRRLDMVRPNQFVKAKQQQGVAEAEKTAKVFHPQYVDVYYLDGPRRTPLLVNRKVPYNLIDRYLELAIKKYNLQQGRFEFRNAEEDTIKVTESVDYLEEK